MIKIRQPVRYGSELSDIEFAQFPELSDTVKTVLDFPVGIQTAVKDRGIASGKFLHSDIAGNLLASMPLGFKNVEELYFEFPAGTIAHDFVFSQKVFVVLVQMVDFTYWHWTKQYDITHTFYLRDIPYGEITMLAFVGTTVSLIVYNEPGGYCNIRLFGFY